MAWSINFINIVWIIICYCVGIDWFKNNYETKLKNIETLNIDTNGGGGVTLYTYTITNNNPYNIYKIYASSHTHNNYINHTQNLNTNNNTNTHNINKTDSTNYIQTNITNNIDFNQAQKENHNNTQEQHKQTQNIKKEQQTKDTQQTQQPNQTLAPTHIDYIIFLDSDDYWKPNCIEECVKHSNGVEIVWFDFLPFFEVSNKAWGRTMLECFHFEKSVKLSKKDWINCYIQARLQAFYFAWSGLIEFNFLKRINLYFLNGVIHEDHNFGCLLFLQSENIYVLKEKFYYYRIRENSITNTNQTTQLPQYVKHIYDAFQDRELAKQYLDKPQLWFDVEPRENTL